MYQQSGEEHLKAFDLWSSDDHSAWQSAFDRYSAVIEKQGSNRLPEHDRWFREELPGIIAGRSPAYITLDEMARVTEWKMARGVWRARNLVLVKGNAPELVESTSRAAIERIPEDAESASVNERYAPIAEMAKLAGVGPATASAVIVAAAPKIYPFFDDIVADQIPGLGPVDYTLPYYRRYADLIRDRAARLGGPWTPTRVERALWSHAGGKAKATN